MPPPARTSIWGPPRAVTSTWPTPRRNPYAENAATRVLVQGFQAFSRQVAQAMEGKASLRPGVTSELNDVSLLLKDRILAGDPDVPPAVRAAVLARTTAPEGEAPQAPKARAPAARTAARTPTREAAPPPDVLADIEAELGPAAAAVGGRQQRTVPGMAAPARPARSQKLADAEARRRTTTAPSVRGMTEEEFYAAQGMTSKVTSEERAKWAARAKRADAQDDLEIVSAAAQRAASAPMGQRAAPTPRAAPAPQAAAAPRQRPLRQLTGTEEEDAPPSPKSAAEARARARLQRTQGLPDEVEEVVEATVVRPAKRIGVRSETSGKTYVRAMDLGANAPVFILGAGATMPTMKRGGHGKTRGPLVEFGQVTLEPGWIRGVGCGDARYDKAGIAVLVNGQFSGRWAVSWEAAEELARRLLAIVAKNNPRRPWAPMSRVKRAKPSGIPRWINKRGAR